MGQGGDSKAMQVTAETLMAEQTIHFHELQHRLTRRAFRKCVAPSTQGAARDGYTLTDEERQCVEEFALMYGAFQSQASGQFRGLYGQFQRDMQEKMRLAAMEEQARANLSRGG